jgi:hypothetical protein
MQREKEGLYGMADVIDVEFQRSLTRDMINAGSMNVAPTAAGSVDQPRIATDNTAESIALRDAIGGSSSRDAVAGIAGISAGGAR